MCRKMMRGFNQASGVHFQNMINRETRLCEYQRMEGKDPSEPRRSFNGYNTTFSIGHGVV